jgi:hypothetical protein
VKTLEVASAILLFAVVAVAKDKKNPANYPLSAHVLGIDRNVSTAHTSSYNAQTGQWTYGNGAVVSSTVEFQIGNLLYTGGHGCRKVVQVGTDVHARLEKNSLFILTNDGRTCDTHIRGVHEVPSK